MACACIQRTDGDADKRTTRQGKSPGKIPGAADPDSRIGDNRSVQVTSDHKTVARVRAKIHLVVPFRDIQSLGQFAGSGAEPMDVCDSTARPHEGEAAPRLESPNQDQSAPG